MTILVGDRMGPMGGSLRGDKMKDGKRGFMGGKKGDKMKMYFYFYFYTKFKLKQAAASYQM